ncbi:PREDICTED: bromodomain-containing protein 4-like [Cyphomyrmex costatus]|uniref:bromodomain-containing protein 4-like n=1 Tax=Cyphomyrmex costatus TaxID=456900 RepID=UPI000852274A|nr:PREDICTED: bromodomain-containing protein 4-like [Cyphomyrmex costatus]
MQGYTSKQFLPQLRSLDKAQPLQLQPPPQPHQQQPPQPPPQPPPQQQQQPAQPPQQRPSQPPQRQTPQPPQQQPPQPQQPRRQHQRGYSPQPPPGSPTLPTPPAAPQRPQSTAARKVTLQLATWKLERLDIPPPARTRPPRYCLHPWDLRVRRYTSPRYQQAHPPARQQELSSGSEWEAPNPETTNRKSEDINGNYWGPEKKTLTQPSLIYRERVTEKRRTT